MIVLLPVLLLQGTGTGRMPSPVHLAIAVRPETVTVGGPFIVTVTLRAPRGAVIRFPVRPDGADSAEGEGAAAVRVSPGMELTEQTASYRMAVWQSGWQELALGEALVTAGGVTRSVSLAGARVYVESVLPDDTSNLAARPARGILGAPRPWWHWLLAGCIGLMPVGVLVWTRFRHRGHPAPPAARTISPFERATEEFRRIEALGLLESEARAQFVALIVVALRGYLVARLRGAAMSHTTTELLGVVRGDGRVALARLTPLLDEADLVKFGRQPVTVARARDLAAEARAIVREVENAVGPEADSKQAA